MENAACSYGRLHECNKGANNFSENMSFQQIIQYLVQFHMTFFSRLLRMTVLERKIFALLMRSYSRQILKCFRDFCEYYAWCEWKSYALDSMGFYFERADIYVSAHTICVGIFCLRKHLTNKLLDAIETHKQNI